MHDVFAAIPKDLRRHRLEEFEHYLQQRDGELDMQRFTLAHRETATERFESAPPLSHDIDAAEFDRHYRQFDPKNPPRDELTLLLALVKSNAAESYGVAQGFQRTVSEALRDHDLSELRVVCQEAYHTRILLSAARLYGLEVTAPYSPPAALKVLIGGMVHLPRSVARPMVLASEIVATIAFIKLIHTARKVLAHAPEIRDAVEERLIEICIDERGHISYNRLTLGAAALAQTRVVLPIVARAVRAVLTEVDALGAYPTDIFADLPLLTDPRHVPEAVQKRAFVA